MWWVKPRAHIVIAEVWCSILLCICMSCHVTKKVYLQRRALTKKIQPGAWDTAVGGHVDYGEEVFSALIRESREELGINAENAIFVCKYPFQSSVERELVHVYNITVPESTKFNADPEEVIDSRFWSIDEIESLIGKGVLTPNFESEFVGIVKPLILGAE